MYCCIGKQHAFCLSYEDTFYLMKKYNSLSVLGNLLLIHNFTFCEELRLDNLRKKTAQERYLSLLKKHPQIFARSPLSYVASFLGIESETLSRLRANKNLNYTDILI